MLKARNATIVVFLSLILSFSSFAFAENLPPEKKKSIPSRTIAFPAKPSSRPSPAPLPPRPGTMQEVRKPPLLFKVNPLFQLKNSSLQVLAGRKEPDTSIYVNNKEVISRNSYNTWYYEYPLKASDDKITIAISFISPKQASAITLDLKKDAIPLEISPPVITRIRIDPATKDIILSIQDPPGIAAYHIYYADSLNSLPAVNPFILAQSDYPVSGSGITEWRDNGSTVNPTRPHPFSPGIKMRFYKLEIARINFQFTDLTPADNSIFLAGAKINIQASAFHPDNDALQYQFSLGGTLVQPWSSSKTYLWQTSSSDTGVASITCEVKDTIARQISKTITCRIINPTIGEILQKVADNYALVNDKKMDITLNSTFNNTTFGSTIYTRLYFKKPDKQRTDTFPDAIRSDASKTEIQITSGPDTYLINPVNNARAQRNILAELNLTREQLNQMDEVYHLPDFLNAHTIARKDNPQDLANGLVMIEAIPKIVNNVYSKLGIQIDYSRGLRTKSLTYFKEINQDKLKRAIEITDSQKMSSGAWVPKGQVKTLYLSDGNLIMTSNFENIQINTGLLDYLFDPAKQ